MMLMRTKKMMGRQQLNGMNGKLKPVRFVGWLVIVRLFRLWQYIHNFFLAATLNQLQKMSSTQSIHVSFFLLFILI